MFLPLIFTFDFCFQIIDFDQATFAVINGLRTQVCCTLPVVIGP
jgi:hypothetical protein